jgi:hypothetical protein
MSISHLIRRMEKLETRLQAATKSSGPSEKELQKRVQEATRDPFTWVTRYGQNLERALD